MTQCSGQDWKKLDSMTCDDIFQHMTSDWLQNLAKHSHASGIVICSLTSIKLVCVSILAAIAIQLLDSRARSERFTTGWTILMHTCDCGPFDWIKAAHLFGIGIDLAVFCQNESQITTSGQRATCLSCFTCTKIAVCNSADMRWIYCQPILDVPERVILSCTLLDSKVQQPASADVLRFSF